MERTADLKEMEGAAGGLPESEHEPYLKAASLLANSFLKKESRAEKIFETLDRYPAGAREKAVAVLLKKTVAGMTVDHIPETAGFWRRYRPGRQDSLIEEVEALGRSYREQLGALRSKAESGRDREKTLDILRQEGIGGSAVAGINLERSPWWQEQLDRLAASTAPELARLKETLLSSLRT